MEFNAADRDLTTGPVVVEPRHAFEAYIQDYDRDTFRACLTGEKGYGSMGDNLERVKKESHEKTLLFCRLKPELRACIISAADGKLEKSVEAGDRLPRRKEAGKLAKFDRFADSPEHRLALGSCARRHKMTKVEFDFYRGTILGDDINLDALRKAYFEAKGDYAELVRNHATPPAGEHEYEKYIRYYDRHKYRNCFGNPLGIKAFPDNETMLFYARLNITFRKCMGLSVKLHEITKGKKGNDRETQYDICKEGILNKKTGSIEGSIGLHERFFYENMLLGRNLSYPEFLAKEKAASAAR